MSIFLSTKTLNSLLYVQYNWGTLALWDTFWETFDFAGASQFITVPVHSTWSPCTRDTLQRYTRNLWSVVTRWQLASKVSISNKAPSKFQIYAKDGRQLSTLTALMYPLRLREEIYPGYHPESPSAKKATVHILFVCIHVSIYIWNIYIYMWFWVQIGRQLDQYIVYPVICSLHHVIFHLIIISKSRRTSGQRGTSLVFRADAGKSIEHAT